MSFPIITETTQQKFEKQGGTGTPEICGISGRACRQMNKEEGANRALCTRCPLKAFAEEK